MVEYLGKNTTWYFVTTVHLHVALRMILLLGQRQGTIAQYGNGCCSGTVKVEFERHLGQAGSIKNFVSNMMATDAAVSRTELLQTQTMFAQGVMDKLVQLMADQSHKWM